jgi:hypothetical protein
MVKNCSNSFIRVKKVVNPHFKMTKALPIEETFEDYKEKMKEQAFSQGRKYFFYTEGKFPTEMEEVNGRCRH